MTRSTRLWRSFAIVGATSLLLAACGGGEDEPSTEGGGDGEETTADPLLIGSLLPQTGSLQNLGPPEIAGVDLAVQEINEAGGVLGSDVSVTHTDSGDTQTDIASASVDTLISEGVGAIIGAASSGVSLLVLDNVVQNETVMISPANTSPEFTDYEDNGFYFRTAPSDVLQGRVLGELAVADGFSNVGIMALDDSYGTGLAQYVTEAIEAAGGTIAGGEALIYDPAASNYASDVATMASYEPDAIVLIGFAETLTIIPELVGQGIGPSSTQLYLVDGNLGEDFSSLPEGTLEGVKGTQPGADTSEGDFQERLLEVDPELRNFPYAPEAYDATILTALAAIAAGDTTGSAISGELTNVSTGGEVCESFADCAALLEEGEDIDYNGQSGPVEWDDVGDPQTATIGVFEFGADNTFAPLEYLERSLD